MLGDAPNRPRSARSSSGTSRTGIRLSPQQRCQPAELRGAVGADHDVVDDPHAVAEAVRAAERYGLVDGRQAQRLAGVNGGSGRCCLAVYSNASRCRFGGYPASAPAMSNPTTPLSRNRIASSAISRDRAACRIAVTRQRTTMAAFRRWRPSRRRPSRPAPRRSTASSDRPAVDVQLGREPDLGVHDVVGGEVLDALDRPPGAAPPVSITPTVCANGSQVAHQRSAVRSGAEERRELVDVGGGQLVVAVWPRPAPAPSLAAARRRGGRAAAPWALAGSRSRVSGVVMSILRRIRSMISGPRSGGASSPTLHAPSSSAIAAPMPLRGVGVQREQRLHLRRRARRAGDGCAAPRRTARARPGRSGPRRAATPPDHRHRVDVAHRATTRGRDGLGMRADGQRRRDAAEVAALRGDQLAEPVHRGAVRQRLRGIGAVDAPRRRASRRASASVSSTTSAGPPPASTSSDSATSTALPTAQAQRRRPCR